MVPKGDEDLPHGRPRQFPNQQWLVFAQKSSCRTANTIVRNNVNLTKATKTF